MKDKETITHLIDYPPRGTACGLHYPKGLYKKGFGTYFDDEVTCKGCQKWLVKRHLEEKQILQGV